MLKYDVKPEIEIFDLSMLYKTGDLIKKGMIKSSAHVQFVFGLAMPPRSQILDFLLSELEEVLPDATWTAAGIGRQRFTVAQWCLERGGHCRTGREDNVRYDETRLAKSNAKLVEKITKVCERYDRRPATAQEAR